MPSEAQVAKLQMWARLVPAEDYDGGDLHITQFDPTEDAISISIDGEQPTSVSLDALAHVIEVAKAARIRKEASDAE